MRNNGDREQIFCTRNIFNLILISQGYREILQILCIGIKHKNFCKQNIFREVFDNIVNVFNFKKLWFFVNIINSDCNKCSVVEIFSFAIRFFCKTHRLAIVLHNSQNLILITFFEIEFGSFGNSNQTICINREKTCNRIIFCNIGKRIRELGPHIFIICSHLAHRRTSNSIFINSQRCIMNIRAFIQIKNFNRYIGCNGLSTFAICRRGSISHLNSNS